MIAAVVVWLGLFAAVHAQAIPCSSQRLQAAFLTEIVTGLPEELRETFCESASPSLYAVYPDDTGVSHFVLPGFIPKTSLGEADQTWQLVRHGQQIVDPSTAEPAVLHLWLRAACIGCVCLHICVHSHQHHHC